MVGEWFPTRSPCNGKVLPRPGAPSDATALRDAASPREVSPPHFILLSSSHRTELPPGCSWNGGALSAVPVWSNTTDAACLAIPSISRFGGRSLDPLPFLFAHLSGQPLYLLRPIPGTRAGSLHLCSDLHLTLQYPLLGQLCFPRGLTTYSGLSTVSSVCLVLLFSLPMAST